MAKKWRQHPIPNEPDRLKKSNFTPRERETFTKESDLAEIFADPVLFASFIDANLWSKQEEILADLSRYGRVAVRAGHSVGKTRTAAVAALWWIMSRSDAQVLLIAPTWSQAKTVDLPEIRKLLSDTPILRYLADSLQAEEFETTIKFREGRSWIRCMSTNDPSRIQGYHGNVLLILDEAAGILPPLFGAFEGIAAGGAGSVALLALGNPTVTSGPFFDMFKPSSPWKQHRIGAFDSPNLSGLSKADLLNMSREELTTNPMPFLITREFVAEKLDEWGDDSAAFQSRVMGEFPTQGSEAIIQIDWTVDAQRKLDDTDDEIVGGLDVAGPGDDETVLVVRKGKNIVGIHRWKRADPRGEILSLINERYSAIDSLRIDTVGLGYHLATHFQDQGLPVVFAAVGEAPTLTEKKRFSNLKAEAWSSVRDQFKDGAIGNLGGVKHSEEMSSQLTTVKYSYDPAGRMRIEKKERLKARGVSSPDLADAFVLCFADVPRWGGATRVSKERALRF